MSEIAIFAYGLCSYALGIGIGYYGYSLTGREREKQLYSDFEREKAHTVRLQRTNYKDYHTIRRLRRIIVRRNRVIRALLKLVPRRGAKGRFVKKAD